MSFVPAPQQASTANNAKVTSSTTTAAAAANAAPPSQEVDASQQDGTDLVFKNRTFDVRWVERSALMYKDGINKVCVLSCVAFGFGIGFIVNDCFLSLL